MNPVVLIATHNRVDVTKKNIISLMMQGVQPKIVLGVSDQNEERAFKKLFPEIEVYNCPNNPLGYKWQMGVNVAKKFNPNPFIVNGSDDILGIDFIENACRMIRDGFHFIGLYRWYILHSGILYLYDYNAEMPLGGGRCYSGEMLKELNYKLFDTQRDKHLDDYAWKHIRGVFKMKAMVRDVVKEGLQVVSIKGNWDMLNPFNKFAGSTNVTVISKSRDLDELKNIINYG